MGGGITLEDIREILAAGVDKVSLIRGGENPGLNRSIGKIRQRRILWRWMPARQSGWDVYKEGQDPIPEKMC